MTDRLRIRIATAATVLFLAGISAAGITAHTGTAPPATTAVTQTAPAPASPSQVNAVMAQAHEHD